MRDRLPNRTPAQPMTRETEVRIVLGLSVPIIGELSRPLHGGLGLDVPEGPHEVAHGTLLAAAIGSWIWMVITAPRRCVACEAMRVRNTGRRPWSRDPSFLVTWALISAYCAISVLGQ